MIVFLSASGVAAFGDAGAARVGGVDITGRGPGDVLGPMDLSVFFVGVEVDAAGVEEEGGSAEDGDVVLGGGDGVGDVILDGGAGVGDVVLVRDSVAGVAVIVAGAAVVA